MLFGHSRGRFQVERTSESCDLLSDLMTGLGLTSDGRLDDMVVERMRDAHVHYDWLTVTDRGVDFHDPISGGLLLQTRAYWWGDEDDPQADLPNLEIPALGFTLSWYKYAFRDSYTSQELTLRLVNHMFELLHPILITMSRFVMYPVQADCVWTREHAPIRLADNTLVNAAWTCVNKSSTVHPSYNHGYITPCTTRGYAWHAVMINPNNTVYDNAYFTTELEAKSWCARRMCEWRISE